MRDGRSQRGFTMLELMIVVTIIMIIAGMTIVALQPTLQQNRAYAGLTQVRNALRQGRETAISARRSVQVQFFTGAPCLANAACVVLTRARSSGKRADGDPDANRRRFGSVPAICG